MVNVFHLPSLSRCDSILTRHESHPDDIGTQEVPIDLIGPCQCSGLSGATLVQFGTVSPLPDPLTESPATVPVVLSHETAIYHAVFANGQLRQLTITASGARPITSAEIRATPLIQLRAEMVAQVGELPTELRLMDKVTDLDNLAMTIDRARPDWLSSVVRAFAVAEHFAGAAAARLVADVNGVSKATAHRWRNQAEVTEQSKREALAQWAQVRELMSRVQDMGGQK